MSEEYGYDSSFIDTWIDFNCINYVHAPEHREHIDHLYIYFGNVPSTGLDGSLDPWIPGGQNTLPEPPHGRAIPRWNRLGKKN